MKANSRLIDIAPLSGYRLLLDDRRLAHYQLLATASNEEIGAAVLACLAASKTLTLKEAEQLRSATEQRYAAWVADVMACYSYASKREMFRDMKSLTVRSEQGEICIIPSHHDRLEGWSGEGIDETQHAVIPAHSDPTQVGAAVRAGLLRCT